MSQLHCVVHLRVALGCVFFLRFARQGCAGLHVLIVFCNSGLKCSAHCTARFNAHEMKLSMSQLHRALDLTVALVCVFFLRFAIQGCCDGLRHLFAFCISGLRWSAYY